MTMKKAMTRRMLLKAGAGSIVVMAGAGVIWSKTRTPTKALQPWNDAGNKYDDVRLNALAYAILAPSPHNRQPWQVELVGKTGINLYCDLTRRLPATDPYDRQITIGLGCFLELLKMAASLYGYSADITPFPDGAPAENMRLDNRRIASINLRERPSKVDPLFAAVLSRRSNKNAFTEQAVEAEQLTKLLNIANIGQGHSIAGTIDKKQVAQLTETIYQGMAIEFGVKETLKESADLMRFGKSEIENNPDGIDIGGPLMETLTMAGILTRENFSDPKSNLVLDYLNRVKQTFDTSQGFVWVVSQTNTRVDQLQAGADYLRLNLKATSLGMAMQPVSQTLQEYAEMEEQYATVHQQLNVNQPARLQMLARIGYATNIAASPRWALKSRLI